GGGGRPAAVGGGGGVAGPPPPLPPVVPPEPVPPPRLRFATRTRTRVVRTLSAKLTVATVRVCAPLATEAEFHVPLVPPKRQGGRFATHLRLPSTRHSTRLGDPGTCASHARAPPTVVPLSGIRMARPRRFATCTRALAVTAGAPARGMRTVNRCFPFRTVRLFHLPCLPPNRSGVPRPLQRSLPSTRKSARSI